MARLVQDLHVLPDVVAQLVITYGTACRDVQKFVVRASPETCMEEPAGLPQERMPFEKQRVLLGVSKLKDTMQRHTTYPFRCYSRPYEVSKLDLWCINWALFQLGNRQAFEVPAEIILTMDDRPEGDALSLKY